MSNCPCPKHPFYCYGHPHDCGCADAMEVFDHAYSAIIKKGGTKRQAQIAGVHAAIAAAYEVMSSDGDGENPTYALSSNNSGGE